MRSVHRSCSNNSTLSLLLCRQGHQHRSIKTCSSMRAIAQKSQKHRLPDTQEKRTKHTLPRSTGDVRCKIHASERLTQHVTPEFELKFDCGFNNDPHHSFFCARATKMT